ncbi:MAG: extracellular solute-binding protein, partial [Spirochaetes bacterium]|nr:extracellular solute-binding protein [Spirochaetota bacterium]
MGGKLAMFNSGIWETPRLRKIRDFDWDVVMFPKGPVRRAFGTGGSGYCIVSTTKHPKEAWEVLKALAGDWGQEMLATQGLAQPANKRIAQGKHWALSKEKPLNKKMLNEAVDYAIYEPFHPKWQEAQEKYLLQGLDSFFDNAITAEEFAKTVVPKVNDLMFKGGK